MSTFLDLLKEMLPNSSDKVQAWIGVIGLILAIIAYSSWKHQKNYDIYINAISQYQLLCSTVIGILIKYWELGDEKTSLEDFTKNLSSQYHQSINTINDSQYLPILISTKSLPRRKGKYKQIIILYEKTDVIFNEIEDYVRILMVLNKEKNQEQLEYYKNELFVKCSYAIRDIGQLIKELNSNLK